MTFSETVGEGIIDVAISGGSLHSLPGLLGRCEPQRRVTLHRGGGC